MLRVHGLVKRRGGRAVLHDVTFSIAPGEIVGLLGANGTGKSTVVSIIAELLTADAGSVSLGGGVGMTERRSMLGVVTQELALYPSLTCEENLRFFAQLHGLRGARLDVHVNRVLTSLDLGACRRTRVEALSGGWQRRVHFAVGLVHDPAVVLLDEPTVGLDVEARTLVSKQIRTRSTEGSAVLLTTQLIAEAQALCDRVIILHDGRVAAQGTIEQLRRRVPAAQLATVVCEDGDGLRRWAAASTIDIRDYDGRATLLLPEPTTVSDLAGRLSAVGLRSIALEPVSLLHAYMEVCASCGHDQAPDERRVERPPASRHGGTGRHRW